MWDDSAFPIPKPARNTFFQLPAMALSNVSGQQDTHLLSFQAYKRVRGRTAVINRAPRAVGHEDRGGLFGLISEPPSLHNSAQWVSCWPQKPQSGHGSNSLLHTHACWAPHQSGVTKPGQKVNIWVAVATSGSLEGGKRPLCVWLLVWEFTQGSTRLKHSIVAVGVVALIMNTCSWNSSFTLMGGEWGDKEVKWATFERPSVDGPGKIRDS